MLSFEPTVLGLASGAISISVTTESTVLGRDQAAVSAF